MASMMRATPLKIFDENQSATQIKSSKAGLGLQNNDGPLKKGLQPSVVKSTRKALSNLSTNQINIRQTPAASTAPMKAKQSTSIKSSVKPKVAADEFYVDDFKPEEMLCTRLQADDDYFDLHKPNKNFHFSAQEPPADMLGVYGASSSPASERFSEQDAEYTAYLAALVNAPMLEFPDMV